VKPIMGIPSIETGVFGGIIVGLVAAWAFNRFYKIQLPPYLGFFAGKRSVPILTACAAVFAGVALSLVWPPIGRSIDHFSHWAAAGNPALAFALYGVVERSLIPFGLHHIWNVPFFFEVGQYLDPATGKIIRGEIYRFTAGDPTAGNLAGGYLFKMWGLPAAALAIWRTARPENRAKVGGIMVSAALTSFLTGITEPIEFSFLFVAPLLYALHAVLAGLAYFTTIELGIRHSTTFSHGLIDFIVLYPHSSRGWWLLVLGPLWALMYYALFRTLIVRWNLKTPGREDEEAPGTATSVAGDALAARVVSAFGGAANIRSLDACITRLRVELNDVALASAEALRSLGAAGVVQVGGGMQAVFGTRSENLKTDIEEYLRASGAPALDQPAPAPAPGGPEIAEASFAVSDEHRTLATAMLATLGGSENIAGVEACALTRLRVELRDPRLLNELALEAAGASGIMRVSESVLHVVLGERAPAIAAAIAAAIDDELRAPAPL